MRALRALGGHLRCAIPPLRDVQVQVLLLEAGTCPCLPIDVQRPRQAILLSAKNKTGSLHTTKASVLYSRRARLSKSRSAANCTTTAGGSTTAISVRLATSLHTIIVSDCRTLQGPHPCSSAAVKTSEGRTRGASTLWGYVSRALPIVGTIFQRS